MQVEIVFETKHVDDNTTTKRTRLAKRTTVRTVVGSVPKWITIPAGGEVTIIDITEAGSTDNIADFQVMTLEADQPVDICFLVGKGGTDPHSFSLRIPANFPFPLGSSRSYDGAYCTPSGVATRTEAAGGPNEVINKVVVKNAEDSTACLLKMDIYE